MAARAFLSLASLIFLAGAIVLIFLVLLAGAINSSPLNLVYFIEADTSAIAGAAPISAWTIWNVCGVTSDDRTTGCSAVAPAYPFDPQTNFQSTANLPLDFLGTSRWYYMTRFMFAFIIIALFFAVCSLFLGVFALCARLGARIAGFLVSLALFFWTIVACLMTANYVQARNAFLANGQLASLGRYGFGFVWGAWAALFISTVLFCVGGSASNDYGSGGGYFRRNKRRSVLNGDASSYTRGG